MQGTIFIRIEISSRVCKQGMAFTCTDDKKGNYDTVILGYSSQIVANTEVIRMAWDDFQEVARENYPLAEIMNKNAEVVTVIKM
ncbi:Efa1/LifA-like protein [Escherichia coli]|uniref:Efa1/LifA-like protein n=1 Tax=Escherichia coli TaxID=562 RepID=A0A376U756_ECOLX|nr:Efa1/LifA-like protein [Escherichia coli]